MTLRRVHHIGVAVADLARAKELLGGALGLTLVRESHGGNPSTAFYRCGEVEIELLEHSRAEDRAAWLDGDRAGRIEHIAIDVDGDLAETLQALAALGCQGIERRIVGKRSASVLPHRARYPIPNA